MQLLLLLFDLGLSSRVMDPQPPSEHDANRKFGSDDLRLNGATPKPTRSHERKHEAEGRAFGSQESSPRRPTGRTPGPWGMNGRVPLGVEQVKGARPEAPISRETQVRSSEEIDSRRALHADEMKDVQAESGMSKENEVMSGEDSIDSREAALSDVPPEASTSGEKKLKFAGVSPLSPLSPQSPSSQVSPPSSPFPLSPLSAASTDHHSTSSDHLYDGTTEQLDLLDPETTVDSYRSWTRFVVIIVMIMTSVFVPFVFSC